MFGELLTKLDLGATEGFTVLLLEYEVIRRTVALSTKCGKFNYINVLAVAKFSTFGCTNLAKKLLKMAQIWFTRVSLEFTRLT